MEEFVKLLRDGREEEAKEKYIKLLYLAAEKAEIPSDLRVKYNAVVATVGKTPWPIAYTLLIFNYEHALLLPTKDTEKIAYEIRNKIVRGKKGIVIAPIDGITNYEGIRNNALSFIELVSSGKENVRILFDVTGGTKSMATYLSQLANNIMLARGWRIDLIYLAGHPRNNELIEELAHRLKLEREELMEIMGGYELPYRRIERIPMFLQFINERIQEDYLMALNNFNVEDMDRIARGTSEVILREALRSSKEAIRKWLLFSYEGADTLAENALEFLEEVERQFKLHHPLKEKLFTVLTHIKDISRRIRADLSGVNKVSEAVDRIAEKSGVDGLKAFVQDFRRRLDFYEDPAIKLILAYRIVELIVQILLYRKHKIDTSKYRVKEEHAERFEEKAREINRFLKTHVVDPLKLKEEDGEMKLSLFEALTLLLALDENIMGLELIRELHRNAIHRNLLYLEHGLGRPVKRNVDRLIKTTDKFIEIFDRNIA